MVSVDPTVSIHSPRKSAEALLAAAPGEQISAAIAAEKWARAADLLASAGERLLLDGDEAAMLEWLAALPSEHVQKSARLATLYAWTLVYAQRYQDALAKLSLAERTLQAQELAEAAAKRRGEDDSDELELNPHHDLKQSMAAVRAHLGSVTGVRLPVAVEDIMLPASADHPSWRAGALLTLGRCRFLAGDLRGAAEDLGAAEVVAGQARGARAQKTRAEALAALGQVAEAEGRLGRAVELYEEVLATDDAAAKATASVGLAKVALQRNDREAARAALAFEAPADADLIAVGLEGALVRGYLAALDGQHDEARVGIEQLEKLLVQKQLRWPTELVAAHKARLALLRGDEQVARRWYQGLGLAVGLNAERVSPNTGFQLVTKALFELTAGQPGQAGQAGQAGQTGQTGPKAALQSAARALGYAEESGHRLIGIEAMVATAMAHHALGHRDEARSALVAALEHAAPEGIARPFLLRGFDAVAEDLELRAPQVIVLREAARALPAPAPSPRERPFASATPRPGALSGVMTSTLLEDDEAPAEVTDVQEPSVTGDGEAHLS